VAPEVARAILAAAASYPAKPTTADAARVYAAAFHAHGFELDQYGNYKVTETERYHFAKTLVRHQRRTSSGDWVDVKRTPLLAGALNLIQNAATAAGDTTVADRTRAAKIKTKIVKVTAERRRDAKEAATKRAAWTHRDAVWRSLRGEQLAPETIAEINDQTASDAKMFEGFGVPPDSAFATLATPPVLPLYQSAYRYRWEEAGARILVYGGSRGDRGARVNVVVGGAELRALVVDAARGVLVYLTSVPYETERLLEKPYTENWTEVRAALAALCAAAHGYGAPRVVASNRYAPTLAGAGIATRPQGEREFTFDCR